MAELTSVIERQLLQLKHGNKFNSSLGVSDDLQSAYATEVQAFTQQKKRIGTPQFVDNEQCDPQLQTCIDYLYHFVLTVNLFAKRATDEAAVNSLAVMLGQRAPVDLRNIADPHIVANAMLLYFSRLDQPFVGSVDKFIKVMAENKASQQMAAFHLHELVHTLPSKTFNTLKPLFGLLSEVAKENETNRMPADRVAEIWGAALWKTSSAITSACECMIQNDNFVFEAARKNRVFREGKDAHAGNSAWKQYDASMYARGNVGNKPSFAGHSGN